MHSYKTRVYKVIPWIIIGLIFMSLIGTFRTNLSLSINNLQNVFEELTKRKFTLDTAHSSYYTSLTFIKVEDISSVFERL